MTGSTTRREFLRITGVSASALLLAGCKSPANAPVAEAAPVAGTPPPVVPPVEPAPPDPAPVPEPQPTRPPLSAAMTELQAHLREHTLPGFALPPPAIVLPRIALAGPLVFSGPAATTLPDGVVIPIASVLIDGPIRDKFTTGLAGNPTVDGRQCYSVRRRYGCKGIPREVEVPMVLRFRTDAAVFELAGVVINRAGNGIVQWMQVDGERVPNHVLAVSSRGARGGYAVPTVRVDFGSTRVRDILIKTTCNVAFIKIGRNDSLLPPRAASGPQMTVVGDSYQCSAGTGYAEIGDLPYEISARLGIGNVAVDAIRGTGYWNSGGDYGNFNDRLASHGTDNSTVFLVVGGINDYGDLIGALRTVWPSRTEYEQAVAGYLQNLRAARPEALIVVTAPFSPNPTLADSSYVAGAVTNTSGLGDFLFKARIQKDALLQVAGPWVHVDVLTGGGWLNSSGASGDVTQLPWFTGGIPAPGTTAGYKPGNPAGGGGGGFGGISRIPVVSGGLYTQAPDVRASGGSGRGLLLSSSIDEAGALSAIHVVSPGQGYSEGTGLPDIEIDPAYEQSPADIAPPVLVQGVNPNGTYPLPELLPAGVSGDLNNVYQFLLEDAVHPSPRGNEYLAERLARSIFDAVMAL